jgi:hypothetical protein
MVRGLAHAGLKLPGGQGTPKRIRGGVCWHVWPAPVPWDG